ncbi:MAG TPA: SDR family NAD(P)-dependent oxidoreductase [Stellaceae bacterium]|jgi:NAD(P)-dependent dehydrogenase (short-subunit alcohol dehydrogenase family)|nr:SDR family NAD(P)-dependent oxidoreductase [Stellaceae bacterium]
MSDLKGRVALVTGGGRGIGRAIVAALHAAGASVVIADNGTSIDGEGADPGVATQLASELGSRAAAYAESIASPSRAAASVDLAVRRFGGLDIIVNNAAILRDAFIFKADPLAWDAVLRNNLSAAFHILAAATPILRDQHKGGRGGDAGWGRIVNIVSSAGLYGNYGQAAYASAKAGLVGLTRVVALDMQRSKVTCNAVAPFAATRVTESIKPANPAQAAYKERALKVPASAVAELVAFLAGDEAAAITGQLFGVRGKEVFLFTQPRPVARLVSPGPGGLGDAIAASLAPHYAKLTTDLEEFASEPIV